MIFFCPVLVCSQQDRVYSGIGQLLHQGHQLKTLQATFEYIFNSIEALVCCIYHSNPRIKEIQIQAVETVFETVGPNSSH